MVTVVVTVGLVSDACRVQWRVLDHIAISHPVVVDQRIGFDSTFESGVKSEQLFDLLRLHVDLWRDWTETKRPS